MKRKLVKQGPCTLMVSLPKEWSKKHYLKKGDEINIIERGRYLHILPTENKTHSKAQINITKDTETAARFAIINAYRNGYDSMAITFKHDSQYSAIANAVRDYLMGLEITRTSRNECLIENVSEPGADNFWMIFNKIFFNVSLYVENTIARLKGESSFSEYAELMYKIHRFDNFCRRLIAKEGVLSTQAATYYSFLSVSLHCPRDLYHLNKYLDKEKIILKDENILEALGQSFKLLHSAYLKKDMKLIEQLHALEKKIVFQDIYKEIQKNSKKNIIYHHLACAIRNLHLSTSPLSAIILDQKK